MITYLAISTELLKEHGNGIVLFQWWNSNSRNLWNEDLSEARFIFLLFSHRLRVTFARFNVTENYKY